jgi:hypothetical protein
MADMPNASFDYLSRLFSFKLEEGDYLEGVGPMHRFSNRSSTYRCCLNKMGLVGNRGLSQPISGIYGYFAPKSL